MLAGEKDLSFYLAWLVLGLAGYARTHASLYNRLFVPLSTRRLFHSEDIRREYWKMPKLPLGNGSWICPGGKNEADQKIVDQ